MIIVYPFHLGSVHMADVILTAFVDDTACGLPINRHPFFMVSVIGLMRPMNVEDGLRWNRFVYFGAWFLDFSSLKIHLGDSFLGWSLLLFVFSFHLFWWIVTWCIVLLLHCSPGVLLGLFVHLPFWVSASQLCHESWGVLV